MFRDRTDAAHRLARELSRYRGTDPLVLAVPRGAVEMGAVLADELGGDLDVVLVKKIGAPSNSELAVGSVTESGEIIRGPEASGIGSSHAVQSLGKVADEVVCLEQPQVLFGISQGYASFPQISDARVAELLRERDNQAPSPS